MGMKLGIQGEWLPTHLNVIADNISRLEDENGNYDYLRLIIGHPSLANCCQFQLSSILISMIWEILLNKGSLDLLIVKEFKPSALGSIISSSS